jgi:hypothetical protein
MTRRHTIRLIGWGWMVLLPLAQGWAGDGASREPRRLIHPAGSCGCGPATCCAAAPDCAAPRCAAPSCAGASGCSAACCRCGLCDALAKLDGLLQRIFRCSRCTCEAASDCQARPLCGCECYPLPQTECAPTPLRSQDNPFRDDTIEQPPQPPQDTKPALYQRSVGQQNRGRNAKPVGRPASPL